MKNIRFIYFLVSVCCSLLNISAQPPHTFTQYKTSDGLYQKTIMHILQDNKGFIWFATWDGIYKFDGYHFKNYKNKKGNNSGFNNSRIDYLVEGENSYLWMISYDLQVYRFDMENETFLSLPYSNYQAKSIHPLHYGRTWIITNAGDLIETYNSTDRKTLFTHNFFEKNHLSKNKVYNLLEDNENNVWILSQAGIYKVIFNNTSLYKIHYYKLPNSVYDVIETDSDIYFSGSKGSIWQYNKKKKQFTLFHAATRSDINIIRSIGPNKLFLGTKDNGILIYDIPQGTSAHFTTQTNKELKNNYVKDVFIDSQNEAWIRLENTLGVTHLSFNPAPQLKHFTLKDRHNKQIVNSRPEMYVCEDINHNIWIHPSGGGLGYYERKTNTLKPFFNTESQSGWDSENKVTAIFSDKQGNLWFGSYNNGLEKVTFNTNPFHLYQNLSSDNESLENYTRANFQDSQGNIWMGIKDQTIRIYDKNLHFKGFLTQNGSISLYKKDKIGTAYCFTEDHKGRIWIGTKGNGIIIATPLQKYKYTLTHYMHRTDDMYSLSDNNIYSMCEDKYKRMWIATFGGGVNYVNLNIDNNTFYHSANSLKNYPINLCNRARYVTTDTIGNIWIGTTNGLLITNVTSTHAEDITFSHYTYDDTNKNSLSNDNIHQILFSKINGNIYLATFGGGLNKVLKGKNGNLLFQAYTTQNHLPANVILSIVEDTKGNLWLATEEELCKFNPFTKEVITYSSWDLPTHFKFNEGEALHTQSGYLLFNTFKGALYFHPDSIQNSKYIPPIVFTQLQSGEKIITPSDSSLIHKNIDDVSQITLPHYQNTFNIQFAALDMKNHDNLFYAYKLEGFETNWNYIGKERSANYTNLPKGHYILKVRSTNSDGIWVDNVRNLNITILPSFWETPLAYLLYALTILAIIFITSYILFVIYRLKHKVSIEQEISDIKLRFFTNISHELRTPLTLITGPVEQLLNNKTIEGKVREQLFIIERNANRMLRLVNQILDFRKIQNKKMKMHVQQIDLLPFVRQIIENFNYLANEQHINLSFKAPEYPVILWADTDKLEKIIFNLISNAFKYTPKGKNITIEITENEKIISISIIDQGVGMTKNQLKRLFVRFENFSDQHIHTQESTGIGLSLTKELVEMHHGTITVESQPNEGSCFTVTLQKGNSHFDSNTEFIVSEDIVNKTINSTHNDTAITISDKPEQKIEDNKNLILLVEDNNELRSFLKTILTESYNIVEADNGETGIRIACEQLPDIIISDIMMPHKNGIELLNELKNNESTSHIPIILLSAKSSIESKIEGMQYGADDYITKPFSATYLKARIQNIVEQRKRLQHIYCQTLFPSKAEKKSVEKENIPILSASDQKFMDKLVQIITENMDNCDFSVDNMALAVDMSRSNFFRKLKSITGQSPIDFLKQMKMKRAVQLIESKEYNISEIAYMTGFNDAHYFSKCFKQAYGISPTEYKNSIDK